MVFNLNNFASAKLFKEYSSVAHGFFNRLGGISNGNYGSLNCGTTSLDNPKNVLKNRLIAINILQSESKLVEVEQTHSNIVKVYDHDKGIIRADAIVTDKKNIALSVVTADCAPILFADPKAGVIAAAHAGWRGAKNGIIENTISRMCEIGAKKLNILAAIGPCISQLSYEVGPEFYDTIRNDSYFKKSQKLNHYFFDLESYLFNKLLENGITKIEVLGIDTYPVANNYFSYRRKTHLNENDYGRQISIILQP